MQNSNEAMREALNMALNALFGWQLGQTTRKEHNAAVAAIKAALALPHRNCDVGTAEEQLDRYGLFCQNKHPLCEKRHACHICGERYRMKCMMAWAQMPYDEGGAK